MKSRAMKAFEDWAIMNVLLPVFIFFLKAIALTYSFKVIGGEGTVPYKNKDSNYIYAFWHRGLIAPVIFYRNLGVVSLASMSKDGEIAARVAQSFGFKIARGSTFKGAAQGLMEIKKLMDTGLDASMNTDGPRGPEKTVSNGSLYLSKLTGRPIIPFGFYCDKMVRLRSWDKTIIMLPFSKGLFKFGDPISVPMDAGKDEIEKYRDILSRELIRLNTDCEEYFGHTGR
jgi:lysophospholipid acyltransferase (LPLAT)-like uncharacterized protein